MLNVNYQNRIGYYTLTENYNGETQKFKIWVCHANCLWADIYFYTLKEDTREHKKGTNMIQLHCFWADPGHLKRGISAYEDANNFHFFSDQLGPEEWKALKILAQAGKTVTIETKKHK